METNENYSNANNNLKPDEINQEALKNNLSFLVDKYIPKDEFDERFANDNYLVINDGNLQDLINNNNNENTNILLDN